MRSTSSRARGSGSTRGTTSPRPGSTSTSTPSKWRSTTWISPSCPGWRAGGERPDHRSQRTQTGRSATGGCLAIFERAGERPSGALEGSTMIGGGGTSHGHTALESDEYRAFVNGKGVGNVLTATRKREKRA